MPELWRRCSACKNEIALGAIHWVCSVSTCNRKRTSLVFCNVDCWEVHLPTERHREAWAIEAQAPKTAEPIEGEKRTRKAPAGNPPGATIHGDVVDVGEILVVASKLKAYVKSVFGLQHVGSRVAGPVPRRFARSVTNRLRMHVAQNAKR